MNPLKLASIRDGVADFGITTHPFLSARPKNAHKYLLPGQGVECRYIRNQAKSTSAGLMECFEATSTATSSSRRGEPVEPRGE